MQKMLYQYISQSYIYFLYYSNFYQPITYVVIPVVLFLMGAAVVGNLPRGRLHFTAAVKSLIANQNARSNLLSLLLVTLFRSSLPGSAFIMI